MVNQAQVGVIDLTGRGYINKPQGGYRSGEFSRLYNCELTEYGSIVRRKGITSTEIIPITHSDKRRYAGNWGQYSIWAPRQQVGGASAPVKCVAFKQDSVLVGDKHDLSVPKGDDCRMLKDDGTLLVDGAAYADAFDGKNWHPLVPEGFVRYNKTNYWIVSGILSTVAAGAYTYRKAVIGVCKRNDAGGAYNDSLELDDAFASGNLPDHTEWDIKIVGEIDVSGDLTDTNSVLPKVCAGGYAWPVITQFMHKDRLWIVTPTRILFSKPTDPFEFRVSQDGGFISMADADINWAVPVGDSIYLFSDTKIDLLTYQVSPNSDGQVTRISTALGADCATEHNNDVYFAKYNALYEIQGTRISKVMDLNLNLEAGTTSANGRSNLSKYYRIWSYYKYLIVGQVARTYGTSNPGAENVLGANKNSQYFIGYSTQYAPCPDLTARPDGFGPKIPTNFYMINTDTGAIQELGYHPQYEKRTQSAIFEVAVMVNENSENQQTLFIACIDETALGVKGLTGGGMAFAYMYPPTYQNIGILGQYAQDTMFTGGFPNGAGTNTVKGTTYSAFVLRDVAPDSLEYNVKKFRSFEVEASIVAKSIQFKFSFDDSAITPVKDVGPSASIAPPSGYRLGLNARGRAMNIGMIDDPDLVNNTALWEIFDLRLLWTYSGRGPVGRT